MAFVAWSAVSMVVLYQNLLKTLKEQLAFLILSYLPMILIMIPLAETVRCAPVCEKQ
jgi:hypothetical protein